MSSDYFEESAVAANKILKSTLTASDSSIDFEPSLRRVQYDLEEIDSHIAACASENTGDLLKVVSSINDCSRITQELKPDLDTISSEYERLNQEFVSPYARLARAHEVAKRLHAVSSLARGLNWYLSLAKELDNSLLLAQDANPRVGPVASDTTQPARSMYTAARLVSKIRELLETNHHLKTLAVVRTHEKTLNPATYKLVSRALELIRGYDGGHTNLRMAILTLNLLDTDKLLTSVDSWIRAQAGTSVLAITRSVGNAASFDSAWSQCRDRGQMTKQMTHVLSECYLLNRAENKVGGDLVQAFWKLVASNIDHKLHTMSVANPTQMRSMQSQLEHILKTTKGSSEVHEVFAKYQK